MIEYGLQVREGGAMFLKNHRRIERPIQSPSGTSIRIIPS